MKKTFLLLFPVMLLFIACSTSPMGGGNGNDASSSKSSAVPFSSSSSSSSSYGLSSSSSSSPVPGVVLTNFTYIVSNTLITGSTNITGLQAGLNFYVIIHNLDPVNSYTAGIWADNMDLPASQSYSVSRAGAGSPNPRIHRVDGSPILENNFKSKYGSKGAVLPGLNLSVSSANPIDYGDWQAAWGANPVGTYNTSFFIADLVTGGYDTASCTLRAVGKYCYIFVQDSEWANGHINQAVVDNLVNSYNAIYPSETGLIGYEPGGGAGGNGGIDANRNIYIVLADIEDGFPNNGGWYVGGYFDPGNEMPVSSNPYSNEKEMFVIDTYPGIFYSGQQSLSGAQTTLVHEFQHMINFAQKTGMEETWLNEGCSMLAEDIFKNLSGVTGSAIVYNERIPFYLGMPDRILQSWSSLSDVLFDYAKSYSYMAYLARNTGPELLHEIVSGAGKNYTGLAALNAALQAVGSSKSLNDSYTAWRESYIYFFEKPVQGAWNGYPASASYYNGTNYTLDAFTLSDFSAYDVNTSSYTSTGSGPIFFNLSHQSINGAIAPYQTIIFQGMVHSSGSVNIHVNGSLAGLSTSVLVLSNFN